MLLLISFSKINNEFSIEKDKQYGEIKMMKNFLMYLNDNGKELTMKDIKSKVRLNGNPYTQEEMNECIEKGKKLLKERGKDTSLFSLIGNMLSDIVCALCINPKN